MGASKNRDTPKWMVKIMENPIKMDDLGVPLFWKHPGRMDLLDLLNLLIIFHVASPTPTSKKLLVFFLLS